MHQRYLSYLLVLAIAATIFGLPGCGGKSGINTGLSDENFNAPNTTHSTALSIGQAIAQIEGSKVPDGVDNELWLQLTGELVRQLQLRSVSHLASAAPSGVHNAVTDLELVNDGGNFSLQWTYVNVGDYDQNSEVNLADLTQIAMNFSATNASADWDNAQVADGDSNGEVNLGDITPIAVNFLATVASYSVYGAADVAGPWTKLGTVDFAAGTKSTSLIPGNRIRYSFALPGDNFAEYRVQPFDVPGGGGGGGGDEWVHTWGGPDFDVASSLLTHTDGSFYLAGSTSNWGAGAADVLLVNYNADGEFQWFHPGQNSR